MRWLEIAEPAGTVLGSPGWWQAGHGLARAVGGRVLAAWVAALGRQGQRRGRRACKSAKIAAKRPILAAHPARTWHRAWHTSDHSFARAMGQKGAQTGRERTSEGRMVGRSKSFVAPRCWSAVIALSAYAPMMSSNLTGRDN